MKTTRNICVICLLLLIPSWAPATEQQTEDASPVDSDVLGDPERFYQLSVDISGRYSDNIFNASEGDKESDTITEVAPGIILTLPAQRQAPADVKTTPTTPGGVQSDSFERAPLTRFQSYLAYSPRFLFYTDNSDENTVNHSGLASVQVNFGKGFTLNFRDRYFEGSDSDRANISTETDTFRSNYAGLSLAYRPSDKTLVQANYDNFWLSYTEDINEGRDRLDHLYKGYFFYRIGARTALFAQYDYVDIGYDNNPERESVEQRAWSGLYWNSTDKTRGSLKAGYSWRQFDNAALETADGFLFQADMNYTWTAKTTIGLWGYHRNEEAPDNDAEYTVSSGGGLSYQQKLLNRLNFSIDTSLVNEKFEGGIYEDRDRTDTLIKVSLLLGYQFRPWLTLALSYAHEDQQSDVPEEEYTGNTVSLRITSVF